MKYVERLVELFEYQEAIEEIEYLERNRRFCRHGRSHALDVARIAYIWKLERGLPFDKEELYLAALLHDIGRGKEIKENIPHEEGGRVLAEAFLEKIEYPQEKREALLLAIAGHRGAKQGTEEGMAALLKAADKQSRNCFACKAYEECYWEEDRKNTTILL